MSSNTENTEAKLAAYIDGQLPPAERAELDQFLAKNPDLQKLLSDLVAQRALLRTLPRDRAPADIYDTIQAQLERSILLDDAGQSITPPVRHSRKSQLFALAAILLLAVGLGAVLYFALPSSKPTPVEVASTSRPDFAATEESDLKPGSATARARQPLPLADAGAASLPPSSIVSNVAPPSPLAQALAAPTGGEFKSQLQSAPSPQQQQDPVVLLVSTNNPAKASQQVATYLASNNISYESVDPAAQQQQQQTLYSRADGLVLGAAPKSPDLGKKIADAPAETTAPADDRATITTGTFASRRALLSTDRDKDAAADQQLQKSADSSLADKEAAPATANQIVVGNPTTSQTLRGPARPYFIARNITREQAAQLTQTLSTEQPSQRARLVTDTPTQKFELQSLPAAISPELTLSLAKQSTATQPTTLPSEIPTTAPTTQANDSLDIVIVVEDQQPATTEPAAQP